MSYKLQKPYTEMERINFIVKYNHEKNLEIEETENALYALEENEIMENDEPVVDSEYETKLSERKKEEQLRTLKKQLEELDQKRIRAICEPSMRTETQSWLEFYNEQVLELRQVMANL
ncbi:hypothetical protein IJ843_05810 [bacterium]|nr:hypothetical protein [bacterium]